MFAIVGLWFMRRSPFVAGLGIGLAGTVKVSLVFYGIAMAWGYRRDWRKLLLLVAGAAVPLGIAYGLCRAARAARGRPQHRLHLRRLVGAVAADPAGWVVGEPLARSMIGSLGGLMMIAVAWMLSRVLPWRLVPGTPEHDEPRHDPLTITVRTAVILTASWLVTSPYTLSWYDLTTWVPLGLMAATRLDALMMWRGAWLSIAYVTGRSVEFSPTMVSIGSGGPRLFLFRAPRCSCWS